MLNQTLRELFAAAKEEVFEDDSPKFRQSLYFFIRCTFGFQSKIALAERMIIAQDYPP